MEVTILNPLKRKQKVIATIDLPGVPEGTEGKIRVANGIEWFRYWVDFDNGTKLGRVDHDDVVKVEDWEQFKIDRICLQLLHFFLTSLSLQELPPTIFSATHVQSCI